MSAPNADRAQLWAAQLPAAAAPRRLAWERIAVLGSLAVLQDETSWAGLVARLAHAAEREPRDVAAILRRLGVPRAPSDCRTPAGVSELSTARTAAARVLREVYGW